MRTNKTVQAILRAIYTPAPTIVVPRKLSTTMGYELTFMPQMFDRLYTRTKGAVKTWGDYSSYIHAQSHVMEQVAAHFDRRYRYKFGAFKTDPMVVEVTTQPTNNGPRLRNIVREAFKYADVADLQPRALCSRGGGAHLHVGLLGDTSDERHAFAAALQHEVALNPWIAWAFANPLDDSNARQLQNIVEKHDEGNENDKVVQQRRRTRMMTDFEYRIRDAEGDAKFYCDQLLGYTTKLHTKEVWSNERSRNSVQNDVDCSSMYRRMYAKRANKHMNDLLALMEKEYNEYLATLHAEAIAENEVRDGAAAVSENDDRPVYGCENYPITKWSNMHLEDRKNFAATYRPHFNTMEFRCFMMYEHHADHAKQIVLADALVRRAAKKLKQCEGVRIYKEITPQKLKDMKYSEAKAAFQDLLRSLDINPEYYREECVNIALRKRALRMRKVMV